MPKYKQTNGTYRASYQDKTRGIARTRQTFNSAKEADEWLAACATNAHKMLIGQNRSYQFGEALINYLTDYSPSKKTHTDDISNAKALRWPVRHRGEWVRIDAIPLVKEHLIPFVESLTIFWQGVLGQRRLRNQTYHLRLINSRRCWVYQADDRKYLVLHDKPLIEELDAGSFSPISKNTIRIRLALVKRVITVAYKKLQWIDNNFGDLIEMPKNLPTRKVVMTESEFNRLTQVAEKHHADLYRGLIEIGWRLEKVVSLEWDSVFMPIRTPSGNIINYGRLESKEQTDNKRVPVMPMNKQVERLLRERMKHKQDHPLSNTGFVFHRGDGRPFASFHKQWQKDLTTAGIKSGITRHGLRHTWATNFCRNGGTASELQTLTGWTLQTCQNYIHMSGAHIASRYQEISELRGDNYDDSNNPQD